jgi:hypothetical protein
MTVRILMLLAVLALAACATPASRISDNQAAFNSYPEDIQQKIRAGEVAIGFTPEMVAMALGEPDHRSERVDATGTFQIWGYAASGPSFGFSVGGGSFGSSSGVGGGVGVSTGTDTTDDKIQITFKGDRVVGVEKHLNR